MSEVTRILIAIEQGDPHAAADLLPFVYDELRRLAAAQMAREKPGQTLNATALVHEAYVRLAGGDKAQHWDSRGHFFAAAAEAMRRILVERARRRGRLRHGGGLRRLDGLDADEPVSDLQSFLKPYPADEMAAYAISTYVNSPKNQGPKCIEPQ